MITFLKIFNLTVFLYFFLLNDNKGNFFFVLSSPQKGKHSKKHEQRNNLHNISELAHKNVNFSQDIIQTNTSYLVSDNEPNLPVSMSLKSLVKLFKKYEFKGYGLLIIKPLTCLKSIGIGFRLPITANFPVII